MQKINSPQKDIFYKLKFIASGSVVASSLSNSIDNLAEGIHKIKCKYGYGDKNVKNTELNTKIGNAILNMQMLKMI